MDNLFEYQNSLHYEGSLDKLDDFLSEIWKKRDKSKYWGDEGLEQSSLQPFLNLNYRNCELKSNNYIGAIYCEGQKINLLPKIFFDADRDYSESEISAMHKHILWWLSYCRRIKFPSYDSDMSSHKSDFFEILIYLFAKYTLELLNKVLYQHYEEINEDLPFIRGRLNINNYITQNLARGRYHKLSCSYDSFELDNKFNRVVKYVSKTLVRVSGNAENKRMLNDILLILDEVTDKKATAEECASIRFSIYNASFETVRDYCYLFLNNSISYHYKNDLQLFAFLLPMEYVFEDFLYGFIEKELDSISVKAQSSKEYLDLEKGYQLRPDLIINNGSKELIGDAKYKFVYSSSAKKTILQADLYQMLAYAARFKIDELILFYPNTIMDDPCSLKRIHIREEFGGNIITIRSYLIPIINHTIFHHTDCSSGNLMKLFEETKNELRVVLSDILLPQATMY